MSIFRLFHEYNYVFVKFKRAAKSYFNIGNGIVLILMLSIFFSPNILAFLSKHQLIDAKAAINYHSFFYNIALSGVGIVLFQGLYSLLKRK